jgi:hypothetical protein
MWLVMERRLIIFNFVLLGLLASAFSIPQVKSVGASATQWSQTYGGTGNDYAYSLVQTGDAGYALAGYRDPFATWNGDFWLVKTDENGVIPEFSLFLLLPLLAISTLFVVILSKEKLPRKIHA